MMKKNTNTFSVVLIFIIVVLLLVLVFLPRIIKGNASNGRFDGFAKCLAEKNITMYGAVWCSHCQAQKARFGESFRYVPYVECPDNVRLCIEKGIEGYPTWVLPDGRKLEGEQELETLSKESGCELPK